MKAFIFYLAFVLINISLAAEPNSNKELLRDIEKQTKNCIVKDAFGIKSICSGLRILSPKIAYIWVEDEWFTAKLLNTENKFIIINSSFEIVATKIIAFNITHVLEAMAEVSD